MSENKKTKPKLLLFTTKMFDKEGYLFHSNSCNESIQQLDTTSALYKHLSPFLEKWFDFNGETFNEFKGENDKPTFVNEVLIPNDTNLNTDTAKEYAKKVFENNLTEEEADGISNDVYEQKYVIYANLKDQITDTFTFQEIEAADRPSGILPFIKKCYLNTLSTLKDVYKKFDKSDFLPRKQIWKIKNENIYAYRCIDIAYGDIYNRKTAKKDFIQAILTDIATSKTTNLATLFKNYQIYLILHRDDIGFPEITKQLNDEEIETFLLANNSDLNNNYKTKEDKTFVFQHDYGIIPNILKGDINAMAETIATEIDNYFKNRAAFEKCEDAAFKNLNIDNLKTKINNNSEYKLY